MKRRKFLIAISAAGLGVPFRAKASPPSEIDQLNTLVDEKQAFDRVHDERSQLFAQHRSHQSHSSHRSSSGGGSGHRSHSSHRSSSGGGGGGGSRGSSPTPNRSNSTPSSTILPRSSSSSSNPLLKPDKFTETAKRVQRGLKAYGYYNGSIDGIIGKGSRAALTSFQRDFSLKITGTITPEVLTTLGIS